MLLQPSSPQRSKVQIDSSPLLDLQITYPSSLTWIPHSQPSHRLIDTLGSRHHIVHFHVSVPCQTGTQFESVQDTRDANSPSPRGAVMPWVVLYQKEISKLNLPGQVDWPHARQVRVPAVCKSGCLCNADRDGFVRVFLVLRHCLQARPP